MVTRSEMIILVFSEDECSFRDLGRGEIKCRDIKVGIIKLRPFFSTKKDMIDLIKLCLIRRE